MSENSPIIYIIIPVHNRLEATRECLDSLNNQTYKQFKVVLVDDGSTDGTFKYVKEEHPEVVLLHGDGDLWWTGATNSGVEYVLQHCRENDYILTLNNDTVLPPGYLETMMSLAKSAPRALIGSIARDYNQRDVVIDEGVRIHWYSAKFTKMKVLAEEGIDSFYSVSVLPGRGTLIPLSVFRRIGLYDRANFPHYGADYDFSLRADEIGYRLLLNPCCYLYSKTQMTGLSNVYNKIGLADWFRSFYSIKSPNNLKIRLRFGLRHAPPICRPSFIVCDLLRVILGTFRNQIRNIGSA